MNWWVRRRALVARLALPALAAIGLGACGDGGVGAARPFDVDIREPAPGEVHFSLPSSVGAGLVSFHLRNSGVARHDAQLIRVTGNRSRRDVIASFRSITQPNAPIPPWVRDGGGARRIRPGQTVVVKQRLAEGDWYLVEPQFLEQGGLVPFTVTSGGSAAKLPDADAKITARDFSFAAHQLTPGTRTVRFENRGKEMHEVVALPLAPGRTLDDAKAYLSNPTGPAPTGPPPVQAERAFTLPFIDRGVSLVTELRLDRGSWVLACFLSDRAGGPAHVAKGMLSEVKIG